AGGLPGGLTLTSGGLLSGTPTASGTFTFTLKATDKTGCTGTQSYALVICSVIAINPATLSPGTVGAAYNQTITQTGGAGTVNFSLSAGALPSGLNLAPSGVLAGTPTQSGTFNFTVKAMDANGCMGTRAYTLVLDCPALTLNPTNPTLPVGTA